MTQLPQRVLLDTNVFIIGFLDNDSEEGKLLDFLASLSNLTLIFSNELELQVRRVGKRLKNRDWVGLLLHYIWSTYHVEYVYVHENDVKHVEKTTNIHREDVRIYLTALHGQVDCMISANRELLKESMAHQNRFRCFDAMSFLNEFDN
ncbi:MAG: hypothetical protein B6242_08080 [Anaerolineaceae bacterium 4572_78]|nr:MAG: hypothetical protein B6242_08080 [Anaerolineaceae bacterium 4572_78]